MLNQRLLPFLPKAKGGSQADLTRLEFINFWLESIYTHCSLPDQLLDQAAVTDQVSPPIIIVGTHKRTQYQPFDEVVHVSRSRKLDKEDRLDII